MRTDELIASLSADAPRVAPGAVARRVALGLGLGALGSAAVMLAWLARGRTSPRRSRRRCSG